MVAAKSPAWLPAGWKVQDEVQKSGRKVRCYTNSKTGKKFFSKKDFDRYTRMRKICNRSRSQPMKRSSIRLAEKKHKQVSLKTKAEKKHKQLVVKANNIPEWLPKGWTMEIRTRKSGARIGQEYKCYVDPLTGVKFYSRPQVSRYLVSAKHSSSTSKKKKIGNGTRSASKHHKNTSKGRKFKPEASRPLKIAKRSSSKSKQEKRRSRVYSETNVVVEKVEADGLPPGWIKEIKTRESMLGIRKDPYYTDPVTGYVFRSKKDALRYIETGEISKHAIKQNKRPINDPELTNDGFSLPSEGKRQKTKHYATRRQLFEGNGSSDVTSITLPEGKGSKKSRGKIAAAETKSASTPTTENLKENHLLDNTSERHAEIKENSGLFDSPLPNADGFGTKAFTENGPDSTPVADVFEEKTVKCNNKGTRNKKREFKNKELNIPRRSSKRLAELKPGLAANLGSGRQAVQIGGKKSGESEATPAVGLADDASQQLEAVPGAELGHDTHESKEDPLFQLEPSNQTRKSDEDKAVLQEQSGELDSGNKNDEKPETQQYFSLVDSWSDPCLEFAFKTLTGAIPVEDNLSIQGYFEQQLDASHSKNNGGSTLADFCIPSFLQGDVSPEPDAAGKPELPVKPSLLPPGNISLPSCSAAAPQQSEGKKDYPRNGDN
ncbi:uncharacterized protein LOC131165095 isoform X2 [Malania oleifera]|uniref:uncharacterized protein LOC131165095 isoform X2 n=1 Tax=Malania oleifera TaxID=397392 RepID=UPI0025AE3ED4|nr:uncharacterized protein LOC131165095 isoform X2 [Malania oleifera]